jgi:crotonobetainyl-CoA:carnitine CoA-transferase CaiB-like acyl-CoA transferase
VETSLLASGMWAMQPTIVGAHLMDKEFLPMPDRDAPANPLTNTYRTSDGRFLTLAMLQSDRYWSGLCEAIGQPGLAADERFRDATARERNSGECTRILTSVFAVDTLAAWTERLRTQEGQWEVVQLPGEAATDPQVVANGYVQDVDYGDGRSIPLIAAPVQFDGSPATLRPAPPHGAHTDEVLLELGLEQDRIAELKVLGAVK